MNWYSGISILNSRAHDENFMALPPPNMAAFYFLVSICLVILGVSSYSQAQSPATTLVNDIVYRADGTPAGGTLLISWPAFTARTRNRWRQAR